MNKVNLIFPNQLFKDFHLPANASTYLIEEHLFFKQFNFHKQKIAFHRASMKFYEAYLNKKSVSTSYIDANKPNADIRNLISFLGSIDVTHLNIYYSEDNWLTKRIVSGCKKNNILINWFDNPLFINTQEDLTKHFNPQNKKFHQTTFYKVQRKKLKILVDNDGNPAGDKWTFDTENRKKYPAKLTPPKTEFISSKNYFLATEYVAKNFPNNLGSINKYSSYPTTFSEADSWLDKFLVEKFKDFGAYEDAIVKDEIFLNHSVISPLLNVGLLDPIQVIDKALTFGKSNNIPLNSIEGFIRQLIGWREFIRGIYTIKGTQQRTTNYWNFNSDIPASFYDGTTGIEPIDDTIKKVLKTGYCHHIERLMILSNFMMLCEFNPDSVYRWFMELFIDAYDWVMVPNVYGMSLYADGGLMTTKPYISSSNYIMKMSNYKKGPWQEIWDGLFWRFMNKHRTFFLKNPRMGMLIRTFDKMPEAKKTQHIENGNNFIKKLY